MTSAQRSAAGLELISNDQSIRRCHLRRRLRRRDPGLLHERWRAAGSRRQRHRQDVYQALRRQRARCISRLGGADTLLITPALQPTGHGSSSPPRRARTTARGHLRALGRRDDADLERRHSASRSPTREPRPTARRVFFYHRRKAADPSPSTTTTRRRRLRALERYLQADLGRQRQRRERHVRPRLGRRHAGVLRDHRDSCCPRRRRLRQGRLRAVERTLKLVSPGGTEDAAPRSSVASADASRVFFHTSRARWSATATAPQDVFQSTVDPQCSDGIDNDADGRVDFPADPAASRAPTTPRAPTRSCRRAGVQRWRALAAAVALRPGRPPPGARQGQASSTAPSATTSSRAHRQRRDQLRRRQRQRRMAAAGNDVINCGAATI